MPPVHRPGLSPNENIPERRAARAGHHTASDMRGQPLTASSVRNRHAAVVLQVAGMVLRILRDRRPWLRRGAEDADPGLEQRLLIERARCDQCSRAAVPMVRSRTGSTSVEYRTAPQRQPPVICVIVPSPLLPTFIHRGGMPGEHPPARPDALPTARRTGRLPIRLMRGARMQVRHLDHVQLAMPAGREDEETCCKSPRSPSRRTSPHAAGVGLSEGR